jgi:TRAP-type C4-dicarboxylate transport system substrate-binding protein
MKKVTISQLLVIAIVAVAIVLTAGCGGKSQDTKPAAGAPDKITIKLAHNLPVTHHLARGMEDFAKKVGEKSQGKIQVNIFPSGQLYNDKSMNDAIMAGASKWASTPRPCGPRSSRPWKSLTYPSSSPATTASKKPLKAA